jgi:hypothetical protein
MFRNIGDESPVLIGKEKRKMPELGFQQQLLHKERMKALEKGVSVPATPAPAPWSPRVYLLRGLIWSLAGVALAICLFGISSTSQRRESYESKAYEAGQLAHNLDIPLDQAKQIVDKDPAKTQGPPTTIALLGLIPLAVGLAYLAFYYSDPSRKLSEPRT